MSKIYFDDVEPSLTVNDIIVFEKKFSIVLPVNYKTLLLKYNGGMTDDSNYFDVLLSIRYGKQTVESMIEIHQIIEKNIPSDHLPIATDWSDNPITICLKEGSDYGKIVKFYFDTDDEPIVIANSLEELLGVDNINEL